MKKYIFNKPLKSISVALCLFLLSCADYLDVVPDNIPAVEHAFKNRQQAEAFLYGCFSFLPNFGEGGSNPAMLSGDEVWYIDPVQGMSARYWHVARGTQGANAPIGDYWASKQTSYDLKGGKAMFTALSDCNIFLENIHKPFDLEDYERDKWIAEVTFLKAYYHFWLFRMYGPIPLIKENLSINSPASEVQRYREPVDEVVDYIVELLDEAVKGLPLEIVDVMNEMGRPTKSIALAVKAQLLTIAASPLYNGNTDFSDMVDNRGIQLFPQTYSAEKWERAATALEEAIKVAHEGGHELFDFKTTSYVAKLNEKTILAMQTRGAATERWNKEIIWGDSNSNTDNLQRACHPVFAFAHSSGSVRKSYAPPLHIVEQFYTKNGVPIEEDKEWVNVDLMGLRKAGAEDKYYIKENFETINLHFDREARFYGSIIFDGGTLYGNSRVNEDNDLWVTELKYGKVGGGNSPTNRYSSTGYLCKKMIHYLSSQSQTSDSFTQYRYAFPIIRLADLYLMYTEVLNEIGGPGTKAYEYIDIVRKRTGLKGVVESWEKYSSNPNKPKTKDGFREIIQRERMNELAFEGARFWDLKRWKLAKEYMNRPIRGLNILGETSQDFYQETMVYQLKYEVKDYLWPIKQSVLMNNKNLLQNHGW
ncbi:RagB/SusD family nutrient uptake outer membrane protein [Dysgonomonas termitidis]|uniref:RagB/SusD family nutrient uptake outer membrane protein n=1 Tax=Dysgonomonas termitidis TaxID=1516126 RepID=A0ABV9KXC5_9BACT